MSDNDPLFRVEKQTGKACAITNRKQYLIYVYLRAPIPDTFINSGQRYLFP